MGKHAGKLLDICKTRKINLKRFSIITGVSLAEIYKINRDPERNISVVTAYKINKGWDKMYGEPLAPENYLTILD